MSSRIKNLLLAGFVLGGLAATNIGLAAAQDAGTPAATPGPSEPAAGSQPPVPDAAAGVQAVPNADAPAPAPDTTAQSPAQTVPGTEVATQNAPPAYLTGDDRLPASDVEAWIAMPRGLLEEMPIVADRVSARTERLVGSDQRVTPLMVSLAIQPETTPEQRAMIVVGLARATRAAEPIAPEYAAYIQEAVARSGSESLISAYNVAFQTTEIATSAIGGGGGGGGGGAGAGSLSGGGDSGNSGSIGGDDVVATTSPTSARGGGGSVSFSEDDGDDDGVTVGLLINCNDSSPIDPNCVAQ